MNTTNNVTNSTGNNTEYNNSSEEIYMVFSYWTENVIQTIIGVVGIASNSIAIPVLCSRKMSSIFNRLLMVLAIFDNFFIICQLLEARRRVTNMDYYDEDVFSQAHEYVFAYFLYQFHSFVLVCCMYITVALALERYQAACKPVEYYNKTKGVNPMTRVFLYYVLPVIVFSCLMNIPKWFEIELRVYSQPIYRNENVIQSINLTFAEPTDLRINLIYVVVWANIVTLTVQGIIPLFSLCVLNYRIYLVMRSRRQQISRPRSEIQFESESAGRSLIQKNGIKSQKSKRPQEVAQKKPYEAQQEFVLFIIVLCYLIFHSPRFLINLHEFFHLDIIKEIMEGSNDNTKGGDSFPIWALECTSVSNCLLTLNSSSNFFIYCFMSSKFRDVACEWILRILKLIPNPGDNHIYSHFTKRKYGKVNGTETIRLSTLQKDSTFPNANDKDGTYSRVVVRNDDSCQNNLNAISNMQIDEAEMYDFENTKKLYPIS